MSRIPSGPPYPHQLPPQPGGYYGHAPPGTGSVSLPPVMHQGGLPPHGGGPYQSDPSMYPFERHPQNMNGGWNNSGVPPGPGPPGQGMSGYHNAAAGPSRAHDPYQAYAQPARSSPSQQLPPRQQQPPPMHPAGWSSIHPGAPSSRGSVKLEDLVSGTTSRPGTAGGAPISSSRPSTSIPVSVSSSFDQKPSIPPGDSGGPAGGGGGSGSGEKGASGSGGAGAGGGGGQQGPSEFIKKLYKMLEEESAAFGKGKPPGQPRGEGAPRGSVGWGRGGTSFVVWDMNDFTTKVLPQTFRHSNFSSFVRQLNKYGFSKIKHVDEETGTIRENVWEFQHPSFVAGGKSDLENIKRKAVAPRKGPGGENEDTSPKAGGLTSEDASRLNVMENRIVSLEGKLERALSEVREARGRESGMMSLLRDMVGHLAANEKETTGSPLSDSNYSPRMLHLLKSYDQVAQAASPNPASYTPTASNGPFSAGSASQMPTQYLPSGFQPAYSNASTLAQTSPRTDGTGSRGSFSGPASNTLPPVTGRRSISGASSRLAGAQPVSTQVSVTAPQAQPPLAAPSVVAQPAAQANMSMPAPGTMPAQPQGVGQPQAQGQEQAEDIIELPEMPTLYNGEPLGMTPMFVETPAWLTEGTTAPIPMYHRKSSDGAALRLMYDVLSGGTAPRFTEEGQAPLVDANGNREANGLETIPEQEPMDATATTAAPMSANNNQPVLQQPNPFEPLVAPPPGGPETAELGDIKGKSAVSAVPTASRSTSNGQGGARSRRTTTFKPHWAQTPRILVVEDDLVYRQLSSKFLEKFGCTTETVENAQGAVEKMNRTKYDLVLMDIFFGPNMDGRKATSLIRQFDNYTPIISMTSNAQPQDVDSYFQSGMNDILAKPFTKHGLFCILDKHLIHLRQAQIYEKIIPVSVGVPPLSDQHVQEALAVSAASLQGQTAGLIMGPSATTNGHEGEGEAEGGGVYIRNPLAGSGWSDETYQLVLQQFLATGMIPDASALSTGAVGTSVIFGSGDPTAIPMSASTSSFRKRTLENMNEDGWNGAAANGDAAQMQAQAQAQAQGQEQAQNMMMGGTGGVQIAGQPVMTLSGIGLIPINGNDVGGVNGAAQIEERESKRARGLVG
ncbi:hypothetical protein IAU59_002208 [Kwoniella sp. CBS 9459]